MLSSRALHHPAPAGQQQIGYSQLVDVHPPSEGWTYIFSSLQVHLEATFVRAFAGSTQSPVGLWGLGDEVLWNSAYPVEEVLGASPLLSNELFDAARRCGDACILAQGPC